MKARKQIYLYEELQKSLKEIAVVTKKTETSIIREAVRQYIGRREKEEKMRKNPLYELVGLCREGEKDASIEHDTYLYKKDKD